MFIYIFIILFVFLIDYISKYFIKNFFEINKEYKISKKISICHIKNYGLAFGFLKAFPKFIKLFLSFCVLFLICLFFFLIKDKSKIEKIAFSILLGGVFGNYLDRLKNKCVTDFIYIKYKNAPIYNIADFCIFFGIFLILYKNLKDFFK